MLPYDGSCEIVRYYWRFPPIFRDQFGVSITLAVFERKMVVTVPISRTLFSENGGEILIVVR